MKKIEKTMKAVIAAFVLALVVAMPVMAATNWGECVGSGTRYPEIAVADSNEAPDGYPIYCTTASDGEDGLVYFFSQTSDGCAKVGALVTNPEGCKGKTLEQRITQIINVVLFIVGLVAVAMIIFGGVSYSISAGNSEKVTKAKNTILYGIIGLVICLLAYAIVNFVIQGIAG